MHVSGCGSVRGCRDRGGGDACEFVCGCGIVRGPPCGVRVGAHVCVCMRETSVAPPRQGGRGLMRVCGFGGVRMDVL